MPWKRRPFTSRDIARALNIADLRDIARRRLPGFVFEYVESGAEDEATVRGNRAALERLQLIPATLLDCSARHQRTTILGRAADAPLLIAPTGLNGLLHPDGDVALALVNFTVPKSASGRIPPLLVQQGASVIHSAEERAAPETLAVLV